MTTGFTLNQLRQCAAVLRANAVPPETITSKSQAKRLTAQDPFGRKWAVGDKYYVAHAVPKTALVKA